MKLGLMKNTGFLLLTSIFISLVPVCFASIPVEVLTIYDGDTIKVKLFSGNIFAIRLIGIDCYETSKIHRAYKQAYNLILMKWLKREMRQKFI